MIGRLLRGLLAKLKAQTETGPNVAPAMLTIDETQPQTQFDFGPSLMHRDQRQMLAVGGIASRLIRKLLKRHKKDPEVQSSIYQVKKEIDDIDSELGGVGSENVELQKEMVQELERDKRYLIEALEDIDATGRPLDFDETGYPVLDDSGGVDFYGDLREPKQEGGILMEEQMGELMPEEAPIPLEIAEETTETMLPDEEMEDNYTDFVIDEALDEEEEQYLLDRLSGDDQLSIIFDKVVETASEFSGSGSIEGPGSAVSDSIPARLSDGEFVMTAKATDTIGADTLEELMSLAEEEADVGGRRTEQAGGYVQEEEEEEEAIQPIVSEKVLPTGRILPESEVSKRGKANADLLNPRMSLFSS
jgi:hypothetical protein